jgi:hypothetical protein
MEQVNENNFADFENPQIIWEIFGELLDFFFDETFCAVQVANHMSISKKLINKALHRLLQLEAITYIKTDHWGMKHYRLNDEFTGLK